MSDPVTEFFITPLLVNGWFNPQNTLVWSVILILGVYGIYTQVLGRLRIRVDNRFWLSILPFISFAAFTRVLRDYAFSEASRIAALSGDLARFRTDYAFQQTSIHEFIVPHIHGLIPLGGFADSYGWIVTFFPTPGSYVITFIFALISLLLGVIIQRQWDFDYWKTMVILGSAGTMISALLIPYQALIPLWLIGGITLLWGGLFLAWRPLLARHGGRLSDYYHRLLSRENIVILTAHFLDATATTVALNVYDYGEQHVIPRMLDPILGPFAMFILKILVVLPALWAIDRYAEEKEFRKFLKIVVFILGIAPGLRNMIRLVAAV